MSNPVFARLGGSFTIVVDVVGATDVVELGGVEVVVVVLELPIEVVEDEIGTEDVTLGIVVDVARPVVVVVFKVVDVDVVDTVVVDDPDGIEVLVVVGIGVVVVEVGSTTVVLTTTLLVVVLGGREVVVDTPVVVVGLHGTSIVVVVLGMLQSLLRIPRPLGQFFPE
jgi:hypothetical protein